MNVHETSYPDSSAGAATLRLLVSSFLLHTEMHCAARRRGLAAPETIDTLLGGVGLVDIDRALLLAAAKGSHGLRSADAIHLATALTVDADLLVTDDQELSAAAASEGLEASGPGSGLMSGSVTG